MLITSGAINFPTAPHFRQATKNKFDAVSINPFETVKPKNVLDSLLIFKSVCLNVNNPLKGIAIIVKMR